MPTHPVSYEPVHDIFEAMRSEQIDGVPLSELIGGGDPERIASETLAVLADCLELSSQNLILDVGCGCGRIATALTQHISPTARYVGVDIVPVLVEFGRKFISRRYPNFTFLLLNEGNFSYDWWRKKNSGIDIAKLAEAQPAGSVDLAISISLFTHLDYAPAREILTDMGHLLAKDGHVFLTMFVIDAEAREGMANNWTGFRFKHRTPSGKLYAEKLEDPTYGVAYEMGQLEELVHSAGFELERRVRGYWSRAHSGDSFQDVLVLRKV